MNTNRHIKECVYDSVMKSIDHSIWESIYVVVEDALYIAARDSVSMAIFQHVQFINNSIEESVRIKLDNAY